MKPAPERTEPLGTAPGEPAPPARRHGRVGEMLVALALGAGLTGFLIALQTIPTGTRAAEHAAVAAPAGVREAPRYGEIVPRSLGVNAGWRSELRRDGSAEDPTAYYGSLPATERERALALFARDERRAYRGAPPVVPHAIDQMRTQACLLCHEHGLRVGDVVVPPMSHGPLTNCTQCHAEASGAPPVSSPEGATVPLALGDLAQGGRRAQPLAGSGFEGLEEPGAGSRAWPGAPPTIPHPTHMREHCNACHGSYASTGLRTSHPWRTSCTQCHAPSAALDQVPVAVSPLTLLR